jgi:hypothetical protein
MMTGLFSSIDSKTRRNHYGANHRNGEVAALIKLSSLGTGYVPWTTSSMRPEAVVHILNEIIVNNKKRILELGMGVTTTCIMALIKDSADTKLLSVDHDAKWVEICKEQLKLRSLTSPNHTLIHAPLTENQSMSGSGSWYDLTCLSSGQNFNPDLLIVDGPPAWKKEIENARVPAFSALSKKLSHDATVFIDDYTRPGESLLLNLFESDPEWELTLKDESANVAILRRTGASSYNLL